MNDYADDTDLIRRLVQFAGTNPAAVAKAAGVAASTVNRPFNGTAGNKLGRSVLEKLQAAYPDFPGWTQPIMSDNRIPFRAAEPERASNMVDLDSVDLAFGMGGTFLDVGDAEVSKVQFDRDWLRANVSSAPAHLLGVITGIGDSMEPRLYDRDLVFFDRSARLQDHVSDKMWVFAFGQIGMIKWLRPLPDGRVKIMSANPSYPEEIASDGELHIIGRVVASLRRH